MKKKLMLLTMGLCSLSLLTGCSSSSKGTYDDYVTLGEYKGLEVMKIKSEVTDDLLQEEIDYVLEDNAEYTDITDRGAQEGDYVNIDFDGTIDGEAFEDGSAEDFDLVIGEGYLLDDLEAGIVDMQTGETKEISVVFPEDYDEELTGKEAVFTVTLNSIQEEHIPTYNDEFVASISDFTTTAEYEEDLRKTLLESQESDNAYTAGADAMTAAVNNATFDGYPEELYESCLAEYDEMNASFAEMLGMDVADLEGTEEEKKEAVLEMVYEEMVLTAIAEKENISVSDKEYQAYLDENYEDYGYDSTEEFEADYTKEGLMKEILTTKVQDFLIENANITEVTEDEYYGEDESYDEEEDESDLLLEEEE